MLHRKLMKRTLYLIILFLGLFNKAKSQHCLWDNCRFIVLDVKDTLTNEIINNLVIILTDSKGNPYIDQPYLSDQGEGAIIQSTDSLKFVQINRNNYPKLGRPVFGINKYFLLLNYSNLQYLKKNSKDKILIIDKKGRYKSTSLALDKSKLGHMCDGDPVWLDEKLFDKTTIAIKLSRRK